ncbi:MAG: adenylate cyclase [Candidatus Parabeggiatoa sp. nov. 3]|nr:MAG: adenylate cyclase [Gammaproteobacteria bacterium]RKZ68447.1 MAG: adenylate cyclase [Gammaproteobacteria bacterium]HEW98537.1 TOMM precursor leader peptide-binding protein [Beggiatoa sp.]
MFKKPKFKRHFHVETCEPEGVFLLSENQYFLLKGQIYQKLVPLLDGQHTVNDIIQLMQQQVPVAEIYYALMLLEKKGYIIENDDQFAPNLAAFCDLLNVELKEAIHRLQTTQVAVHTIGAVNAEPLISALESLQIQVQTEGDIDLVLTDDYLQNNLADFNQKALQLERPWLLVKPVGTLVWIGPLFHKGKTGCWECLAQRLRANRPVETFIQTRKKTSTPFPTSLTLLPSTLQMALNLTTTELLKWIIQGENKNLEGILVTLDTLSLKTQNHFLVHRPQCPSCGTLTNNAHKQSPKPIVLETQQKIFIADGGHRCMRPQETFNKYRSHISPITGVIRELDPISQNDHHLTHTYIAGHNFATMFDDLYFLRENVRGRSAGKGKTDSQAKASAICEAIERYSGVFQGDEIRQKGRYRDWGERAIHPNACLNFSQAQYQNRHHWNANTDNYFEKVPEPFDEEREIDWTPVWSLTHNVFKYLPTAYCYYGYPRPEKPDCWADSNGAAAGNSKEEAILQGFMELVERDSVALWWFNYVKKPRVHLDRFDEPYFQALQEYYQMRQRELWVLDITSDLNIPAFAAISRRIDQSNEKILCAFGAHFDPKIGILRALTELNQMLEIYEKIAQEEWKMATLENQPYLVADDNQAPKVSSDYPQLWSDDLRDDVRNCVAIAKKQGLEVLVLDQTRPDIGLNVLKVIVPGMRHFWRRLGPGRLYDVPVKLGWLSVPLTEKQLNPMPVF